MKKRFVEFYREKEYLFNCMGIDGGIMKREIYIVIITNKILIACKLCDTKGREI